jgi:hypothetical protein
LRSGLDPARLRSNQLSLACGPFAATSRLADTLPPAAAASAGEDVFRREIGETWERVILIRQALEDREHDFALELAQDLERDLEANLELFRKNSGQ